MLILSARLIIFVLSISAWPTSPLVATAQLLPGDDIANGLLPTVAWTGIGSATNSVNPAALESEIQERVGIKFSAHVPFGIPEIKEQGVSISSRFRSVGVSVAVQQLGFDALTLTTISATTAVILARSDDSVVRVGLLMRAHRAAASFAGANTRYGIRLGIQVRYGHRITLGSVLGSWGQDGHFDAAVGIQVHVNKLSSFLLDIHRTTGYDNDVRIGVDLGMVEQLRLRLSMASQPRTAMVGILIHIGRILSTISVERHYRLGYSRSIGITALL